jgi:hypothetical protein
MAAAPVADFSQDDYLRLFGTGAGHGTASITPPNSNTGDVQA